jgi:coenzyme F420 hydrogenase subunit beta
MDQGALNRPPLRAAVPRNLCTDCGISRSTDPGACGRACQFIRPDYAGLEARVHGRPRDPARPDELHFGPFRRMLRASLAPARPGAQWTGITTRMAERLLEAGAVDAVLTMAPDPEDRWRPVPVLVTRPEGMAECRGMRMGYAPLLALLEPARAAGHRRLAVIGIPCQVYALRALEAELGFERLYVIGTPCSDNTTTERFHQFLALLAEDPATVTYLEFRADYHVELRFADGRVKAIPFLQLPLSRLPADFFPLTCRSCVDYANVLADVTVGYMAGQGEQWLLVRNARGEELVGLLGEELRLAAPGSAGRRQGAVRGFLANLERAAGGLPLRRMPDWLRPVMGWLMPRIGPRGLEFARARLEMKALETVLHLRREVPARMKSMIPPHVWALAAPYGLAPRPGEKPGTRADG